VPEAVVVDLIVDFIIVVVVVIDRVAGVCIRIEALANMPIEDITPAGNANQKMR
jgi:hypothetical protein